MVLVLSPPERDSPTSYLQIVATGAQHGQVLRWSRKTWISDFKDSKPDFKI